MSAAHTQADEEAMSPELRSVRQALAMARHYLPSQGPIPVFVHHNTLHYFEHLMFEDAVEHVAELRGTQAYMQHTEYLEAIAKGRINASDIDWAVADGLQKLGLASDTRSDASRLLPPLTMAGLWKSALHVEVTPYSNSEVHWLVEENSALAGAEDLWQAVLERCASYHPRNVLVYGAQRHPAMERIDSTLIALSSAFLDRTTARWPMPTQGLSFLQAFLKLSMQADAHLPATWRWLKQLPTLPAWQTAKAEPLILSLLHEWGIPSDQWPKVLRDHLLALPGWAGLAAFIEEEPSLREQLGQTSLADFLAVSLLLYRCQDLRPLAWVSERSMDRSAFAYQACLILRHAGVQAKDVLAATENELALLWNAIDDFGDIPRRRVLHQAYERHYRESILSTLAWKAKQTRVDIKAPAWQLFCCLDEREESLRRHVEELNPQVETFGVAGFFGVDMQFSGLESANSVPLCPVVVKPKHHVVERPRFHSAPRFARQQRRKQAITSLFRSLHRHSRRAGVGPALLPLGLVNALPMLASVYAPRLTRKIQGAVHARAFPPLATELVLLRESTEDADATSRWLAGYTAREMSDRVEGILRTIGLTKKFAPLVLLLGHGSTTTNNPFHSAYDCGACGGRRGHNNARAFAAMANRPDVRSLLAERNLLIPASTHFLGGVHDTCTDGIELFDVDMVPENLQTRLSEALATLEDATAYNAHERSRRFAGGHKLTPASAKAHVEGRAHSPAEPRPEYGHGSNAACIIGRRSLSRELFLDRRSFLISYDTTQDKQGAILTNLLRAVMPVCAGINLEYYFSRIDNTNYGCGTKLPHNVVGQLGVMDGHASDLRTGLPWQTVEIHEPMRLLTIVEANPQTLAAVIKTLPTVQQYVEKSWVQMFALDPDTGFLYILRGEQPELYKIAEQKPPVRTRSFEHFVNTAEHLKPAHIKLDLALTNPTATQRQEGDSHARS